MASDAAGERTSQVDRASPLPLYVQVKQALRAGFAAGRWKPGDLLPGEHELCRIFEVSRIVVRQALQDLAVEGLVVKERGKGTFVARPKISGGLVQELTGFYSDMIARGYRPVTRVLRQEVVAADAPVAEALGLEAGARVVQLDRLRFVEDQPIVLVTTYLPHELCAAVLGEDLSGQSLYAVLEEKCGLVIETGRRTLEAVAAGKEEARLLGVELGAPLMKLDSVSLLADGTPVEYYRALHRGDRSRFEVKLIRSREGRAERGGAT
jgi:GntR family transcriptional regulator